MYLIKAELKLLLSFLSQASTTMIAHANTVYSMYPFPGLSSDIVTPLTRL